MNSECVKDKPVAPVWLHKWKSVIKYHKPIPFTNIIPCKVPLDSKFSEYCGKYDKYYGLDELLASLNNENKKVKLILDINKSKYYYNSDLFQPENRETVLDSNLKKTKRTTKPTEHWQNEDFKDTHSELAKDVHYVKAPLSNQNLIEESEDTLLPLFKILDQYVLHTETAKEDLNSVRNLLLYRSFAIFDEYISVNI